MVNLNAVVGRLLEKKGLAQIKEAAGILGISPADLSNRKKRGTLLPLLIDWAINKRVNLHWFITGERVFDSKSTDLDPDPEIAELLEGARKVLTSGNPIAFNALEQNIRYFSHAIDVEKRMRGMENDVSEMKRYIEEMKRQEEARERALLGEQFPDEKAA